MVAWGACLEEPQDGVYKETGEESWQDHEELCKYAEIIGKWLDEEEWYMTMYKYES